MHFPYVLASAQPPREKKAPESGALKCGCCTSFKSVIERNLHLGLPFLDPWVWLPILVDDMIDVGDWEPQEYPRSELERNV